MRVSNHSLVVVPRTWTTCVRWTAFVAVSAIGACTAPTSFGSETVSEPSLRDGGALMRGRPQWSPPAKTLGDPAALMEAVEGSFSARVEVGSLGAAEAAGGLRVAMEGWLSRLTRSRGPTANEESAEVTVTVRELDKRSSNLRVRQAGGCEPLRQWFALYESLELARYGASLGALEGALRTDAQIALRDSTSWRALEGASVEASSLPESAAHSRCRSAAASLHERLTACVGQADACVDTPTVTLDGAVALTRVDPWYPDRETCLAELGAPAREFEAWISALADRGVAIVAAHPSLAPLDRLARTRRLFEAVEDLCVPRRRVVESHEVDRLNNLLDTYGDLYGVAAVQTPAVERSNGVVYVAGRGTMRELGRTRPTSVARQLEALVHDFRAVSEGLGHCDAVSGPPLEIVVARDGVEVLRMTLFPEQLWCTPDPAAQ